MQTPTILRSTILATAAAALFLAGAGCQGSGGNGSTVAGSSGPGGQADNQTSGVGPGGHPAPVSMSTVGPKGAGPAGSQ